jgi:hypothetical protein
MDEQLYIRIFFMVLNNNFFTPNTYCYIRPVDALWCCDTKAIAGHNWCQIIYDNTRDGGQKWKTARHLGMEKPTVLGWSIFLMLRSVLPVNIFNTIFYNTQVT